MDVMMLIQTENKMRGRIQDFPEMSANREGGGVGTYY